MKKKTFIKKNKILISVIVLGVILATFGTVRAWILISEDDFQIQSEETLEELEEDIEELAFGSARIEGTHTHIAIPVHDQIITGTSAILHRILVGPDIANSEIAISDHETTTAESILWYVSGSTLQGFYDIGAYMINGIVVTVTNQQNVTFIFDPR